MSTRAHRPAVVLFAFLPFLFLTSCGIRGLHVPQSPLLKLFESKSGRIAYVGVHGDLFISDQTGSVSRLTNDAQSGAGSKVSYIAPTWSPNGKRLAFARYLTNPADGRSTASVRIIDVQTKHETTLLAGSRINPFYLDWSPRGAHLAILSDLGGGQLELGVAATGKPNSYTKLDSGAPYYWTWSSTGNAILAHTDFTANSGGRISIIPLSSGSHRANLPGTFGFFQAPASLSNGNFIAAVLNRDGTARIAILDSAGVVQRHLSGSTPEGFLFSLSPNHRYLAYLEARTGPSGTKSILHVVDVESGQHLQTLDSFSTVGFYWSPDSSMIALIIPAVGKSVPAEYSQIQSLPHVSLQVLQVADGKTWSVATFPPTQSLIASLPYTDQYQRSQTIWAPDAKHLVYTAYASDGLPGIFVADSSGNVGPTKIASGDSASWSWK